MIPPKKDEDPEPEVEIVFEPDYAYFWRYEQLVIVGYPDRLAKELALDEGIDLHQAIELVEKGCDPQVAASILL